MRRFAIGLACGVGGYLLAALGGYFLIAWTSSNVHDRSVEAAMTGVFVVGPFAAVVAFVVGVVFGGKKPNRASADGSPDSAPGAAR
ncbi:MAG: hypothetical protein ACM3NW_01325 [Syntrophomonadaceae bacterium]